MSEPGTPVPAESRAGPSAGLLFGGVLGRGPVADAVSGDSWVQAMLEAEAALAGAGAATGLVPPEAAARIQQVCRGAQPDPEALGAAAASAGNPVVPLVRELERAAGPGAGAHVHRGATSQDVLDTAMVLVARRALDLLLADLRALADTTAALAREHRGTVLAGRTLMQQALPTTFGLKAAGWLVALDGAAVRLRTVRDGLPVQLGGAVGTLSAAGPDPLALVEAYAAELGLAVPVVPWHTVRLPVADLAGALGTAAGVLGKIALDVVLLAQTEVAEVAESAPDRGGSSTMPHKRNPVAAVSARAAARRAPGLVATLLAAMEQEHERAAGAWHSEWEALSDLLRAAGSAAAWLLDCLGSLEVDPARMRDNLDRSGAALAAEAVAGVLAAHLGRGAAHDLVALAVRASRGSGRPLRDVLLDDGRVGRLLAAGHLTPHRLDALLDPGSAVGHAGALVDRAVAHHERQGQDDGRPYGEEQR